MTRVALALALTLAGCQTVVAFETPAEQGLQCADGVDNDGNGAMDCQDDGCAVTLACLGCGDGTLDPNEECDDRNQLPNDGCGPGCVIERCGDGVPQAAEACDDGNLDDTDGCLATCAAATCGDGFTHLGVEGCDDANPDLDDGCTPACVIERCGDGIPQAGPTISSAELIWLASACVPDGQLELRVNGSLVLTVTGDPLVSCTCAPVAGINSQFIELPPIVNGVNALSIAFPGPDDFLGWAVLRLQGRTGPRDIVLYEGQPGAAAAQVPTMCTGGFDADVVAAPVSTIIATFEECDDGNAIDGDGCETTCRSSP